MCGQSIVDSSSYICLNIVLYQSILRKYFKKSKEP